MTKIQLLATILALVVIFLFASCSKDYYAEPDILKVTPELRARIDSGMRLVPRAEKSAFNEKIQLFLDKCDEMGSEYTPYQYLETEEYADLKEQILHASPATCYLLMDRYLKRNPPVFAFMLNDLIETAYPTTADEIAERMKTTTTVRESIDLYPQVCLEIWLDDIENR